MIHTVKVFGTVNNAEVHVFLELSCFLDDPLNVGNLISGSSAFSKSSLNIWKFMVHELLKPGLENFEHYFTGVWDECNCVIVWTFFGMAFLWDRNENWPFLVLWPLLFSKFAGILSVALSQHHLLGFEIASCIKLDNCNMNPIINNLFLSCICQSSRLFFYFQLKINATGKQSLMINCMSKWINR